MTREQKQAWVNDLANSDDPKKREQGFRAAQVWGLQVTVVLPEVRPGIYANTTDPAFLAALERPGAAS